MELMGMQLSVFLMILLLGKSLPGNLSSAVMMLPSHTSWPQQQPLTPARPHENEPALNDTPVRLDIDTNCTRLESCPIPSLKAALPSHTPRRLTQKSLAEHNATVSVNTYEDEDYIKINRLEKAASELGFSLPKRCFEREANDLRGWVGTHRGASHQV
ncbi:hypothetical protein BDV96DRAFT_156177 [Lophiotrema nucula]|uniref:Uncharacterized protein n=1 Tax=Lophiotrema nucula TaxID=690887 RepID=A0A6A5YZW0_9PLEO|nr:hypothetical protein BDV96DRAFT_156177 [Lophiotrema nucula]